MPRQSVWVPPGQEPELLFALKNAPERSLIVVFTDNGTKDLNLETEIVNLKTSKDIEVFIVLTPVYGGSSSDPDLAAYGRMGKVFKINEIGADNFLREVEVEVESNCV